MASDQRARSTCLADHEIRLAVVGSREWADRDRLFSELAAWIRDHGRPTCIISGGARGADTLAQAYAAANNIPFRLFEADWSRGRRGGPERNERMLAAATHVMAFCCGDTPGTRNAISIARRLALPVAIVNRDSG